MALKSAFVVYDEECPAYPDYEVMFIALFYKSRCC